MKKVDWANKEHIKQTCASSVNYSDACRKLGINPPSNMRTLKQYIHKYDIDVSHFQPLHNKIFQPKIPLTEILVENSTYHRWHLKKRLIKENMLENICSECGLQTEWNGQPLNMHLDHINGVNTDNRIENLRLLCPNCHSQTPTYAGRNKYTIAE